MHLEQALERRDQVGQFLRKHRIGLLTLMFTDIVGSTRLKQQLGEHAGILLIKRHHTLVRDLLHQFTEAEEIDRAGDSFFLVFAKPSDAVKFSLLLQARLRALAQEAGKPVLDRVGIHIGEVVIEERAGARDLYGLQVDTCARVMSLAQGGQVLLTRSAFDHARQALKGQELGEIGPLDWRNHGPYVMKGLDEPVEVCEVGETQFANFQAPPDSEKCQRQATPGSELVLGWRPALGQMVPGTKWVLEEKLGEGGFGEVWLARQERLQELRVFKFCFRADRVRSLKREVTLFRLLKERVGEHPNLVHLLEVAFDESPFYVAMEYVPGRDLRHWFDTQGGLANVPVRTRLDLVAQVAEGLHAAHEAGIIHRDIKPENILIADLRLPICDLKKPSEPEALSSSDRTSPRTETTHSAPRSPIANQKSQIRVKVTDFGIGQVLSQEYLAGLTRAGFTQTMLGDGPSSQTGTQVYMAPELLAGKPATVQSDLYALGVVAYQLMVGDLSRPLPADWADEIRDELLREDLWRCFAGNPEARFKTAAQFAQQLHSLPQREAAQKREGSLLGALMSVLLGWVLLLSPLGRGLILSSYDLLFGWPSAAPPSELVIIYLDESAVRTFPAAHARSVSFSEERLLDVLPPFSGTHPRWSRTLHARLLERLTADGAKAVIWDIIFHDPDPDPKADAALARAIKANGKVVLAGDLASIQRPNKTTGTTLVQPLDTLLATAAGFGTAGIVSDPDLVVRRHQPSPTQVRAPPLSWAGAISLDRRLTNQVGLPASQRWVNYYGPPGFLPTVNYVGALSTNEVATGFFRNKIALIGSRELLVSPGGQKAGSGAYRYPGSPGWLSECELQATLLLNLVRGDWLRRASWPVEMVLVLGFGALLGAGLVWIRRRVLTVLVATLALAACFGLALGCKQLGFWFPYLIVAGVQLPVALLWALLYPSRQKLRRRQTPH